MKKIILIITGIMLTAMLAGCGTGEDSAEVSLFAKKMIVGTDIAFDDITDFYYTEEKINYDAFYQRYRFYVEDGKHLFFHETRERKNDYGPCTEEDTVQSGTLELSDDQWSEFTKLVKGGTVTAREDSADSGGSGPWLYLYWTDDKSKYQQFSFESYGTEAKFEEFCLTLAPKKDTDDRLTDEQALLAIKNYCYYYNPDLDEIADEGGAPVYWEIESSDEKQIVVLFRSYTGALVRYYIEPVSGETYVTEFVPGITDEEEQTDESFDIRMYLEQ